MAAVVAIDAENTGKSAQDLPQHRCLDSFQYFPRISLELLENAAFPFASRRALKYR
ncbi:hypothetical protein IVB22_25015 [Bradyrhizobium sp. 190]|uniref:hypothetical protein n=1 Tax=Bradyrhizobium sp. 190 TaxID=2782658 RepID=UPI001FF8AC1D|nr:hypothetical protein [Bradyrhizobium sp. 190]MCK1515756.1 hypothetical protein [Bradyrhizobium sp. 190]